MKEVKLKFLGSGSAFVLAEENYQSNILITVDEKHLLYDAGSHIPESLNAAGLIPQDIDSIYISHLHDDHAGGIEYFAFKTYFEVFAFGKSEFGSMKPNLYGHQQILIEGWEDCWKGGLQSIQGQVNSLESYFNTVYLRDNDSFVFQKIDIHPIQTVHVVDNRRIVPSYGIMIDGNKKVFISGDSQFSPNSLLTFYNQADLIFHDCEMAKYPNSVHAQFHELCGLDSKTKSKMWLYHYKLNGKSWDDLEREVLDAGFAGLVKRGQEFTF